MRRFVASILLWGIWSVHASGADTPEELKVRVSWGHEAASSAAYFVRIVPSGVEIPEAKPVDFEDEDGLRDGAWRTKAGGGDVDGLELVIRYLPADVQFIQNVHIIWADLIAQSDPDTARRLKSDPAFRRDARRLVIQLDEEGTRGFSLTIDQLLNQRTFWVPSLDVYVDASSEPVSFAEHKARLSSFLGKRILGEIHRAPEATYEEFKACWEDMGNPLYQHPAQPAPGHIICLTWDSAIHKFGVDRGAGVWNDLGNPDRFRFWFGFGDLATGIAQSWKGQRLTNGFPVVLTMFEKDGIRYEVEQFAYPLNGPPNERRGDIPMVLLQKVKMTEMSGRTRSVAVTLNHRRKLASDWSFRVNRRGDTFLIENTPQGEALFSVEGITDSPVCAGAAEDKAEMKRVNATVAIELAPGESRHFIVKLPSPVVKGEAQSALAALEYAAALEATLKFWAEYEARGARFTVPERAVNELFRANLWHALRLPRRHGGRGPGVGIDLPYSNFAYSQTGIPWPVNQSVYVDYMIYDLRGYHELSAEELAAILRSNQEPSGRIKGYAEWLVYTPSTLYAVAKNYLLSQDKQAFEELLPGSLKAMDWCLEQARQAQHNPGTARGLVHGPLNDGTGVGYWAFNQAYMFAGLDVFGRALERSGHPRAEECLAAARELQKSICLAFGAAALQSPLVQLRDHTWISYVPCEATRFGRLLDQWYPTDVDTGAVHLLRLKAVPSDGDLAESLLNDHEDNLYLHGWGMANEPVYNPQGTAYLLRDDPAAAIRTFYSMMACAFGHSTYEPVEHRWTHGQYFGPPSTDGAWAELYRNMLIQEQDDGTLLLFAATPRKWLDDGKKIEIVSAPTYYGKLSASVESRADSGKIMAEIEMSGAYQPRALRIRLRHPQGSTMRSVTVDGQKWTDFDAKKEWVRIQNPTARHYAVVVEY